MPLGQLAELIESYSGVSRTTTRDFHAAGLEDVDQPVKPTIHTVAILHWAGLFITAADVLIALALAKRSQSSRGSDHESYSSSD